MLIQILMLMLNIYPFNINFYRIYNFLNHIKAVLRLQLAGMMNHQQAQAHPWKNFKKSKKKKRKYLNRKDINMYKKTLPIFSYHIRTRTMVRLPRHSSNSPVLPANCINAISRPASPAFLIAPANQQDFLMPLILI